MDLDLKQNLYVGERNAAQIRNILASDSNFLQCLGIIDYSLLIGIHFVNQRDDLSSEIESFSSSEGSAVSAEETMSLNAGGDVGAIEPKSPFEFTSSDAQGRRPFLGSLRDGGLLSTDRSQIYYIGIIDFLQQYDVGKRAERFAKVVLLRKDPQGLSVQSPLSYQTRFLARLSDIFE